MAKRCKASRCDRVVHSGLRFVLVDQGDEQAARSGGRSGRNDQSLQRMQDGRPDRGHTLWTLHVPIGCLAEVPTYGKKSGNRGFCSLFVDSRSSASAVGTLYMARANREDGCS